MANDLNLCVFIGRLGADPDCRTTTSGKEVARFRIAVNKSWKEKTNGEKKEVTEWIPIIAWSPLADICREYLKKGTIVQITGEFRTRKWQDKDGQDRYSTEIVADRMQMLGGKSDTAEKPEPAKPKDLAKSTIGRGNSFDDIEQDIPF